jgi:hypothetical protein
MRSEQLMQDYGKHGLVAIESQYARNEKKRQQLSCTLIAAVSQSKIEAAQIVEGGVDAMIYEKFIFDMLAKLRADPRTCDQRIVLLMDNVAFHKHESVLQTAMQFKVNVLFNVEYSPMLNPIERVFNTIKAQYRRELNQLFLK